MLFRSHCRLVEALGKMPNELIDQLNQTTRRPAPLFPGATGQLYLNVNQRISRQLRWAQFVNGKPHGIGKMRYADGSDYNGGWKNGMRHGLGTYSHRRRFVYSVFPGPGPTPKSAHPVHKIRYPTLVSYEGLWHSDRPHCNNPKAVFKKEGGYGQYSSVYTLNRPWNLGKLVRRPKVSHQKTSMQRAG